MILHDEIAKVAFELYEKSGRVEGRDQENWLEAEKIVKAKYTGTDLASVVKKVEEAAEETVHMVKEAVKDTIQGLSDLTKKVAEKKKPK